MGVCSFCGAQQPEGVMFCDECGRPLDAFPPAPPVVSEQSAGGRTVVAANICPSCGLPTSPMDAFCDNCGAPLRESQPPPPPSVTTPDYAAPTVAPPPSAVDRDEPTLTPGNAAWDPVPPPVFEGLEPAPRPAAVPEQLCDRCGGRLTPGSAFCDMCGALVGAMPEAALVPGEQAAELPLVGVPAAPIQGPEAGAVWQSPPLPAQSVVPAPPTAVQSGVMARLVHEPGDVGLALPVGKTEATVGRDDPIRGIYPDLDLTDYGGAVGGVSRVHACITTELSEGGAASSFYVEDLDSVNGTFVNEERVLPGIRRRLQHGDVLRLGRVKVTFQDENTEVGS